MPGFGAYAIGELGLYDIAELAPSIAITYSTHDLPVLMNLLAGTTGLDEVVAANRYAGTTGLDEVAALNSKAGTTGKSISAALSSIAGIANTDAVIAAERILYGTSLVPDRPVLSLVGGNTQVALTWTGVIEDQSYRVYRGTSATALSWIASVGSGTTTYTSTGLTNGTPYYFQVGAFYAGYETLSTVQTAIPA